MRKVSKEAARAFWQATCLHQDNTEVRVTDGCIQCFLFGNLIAERNVGKNYLMVTNAGWPTPTTKDRLNAILAFLNTSVFQKGHVWYLQRGDSKPVEMDRTVQLPITLNLE
jgi:hypothetical protein